MSVFFFFFYVLQPHEGCRCLLSIFHHLRLFFICLGLFARPVSVFGLRVFAWRKCLKAEIVRLSSPAWERLPAHPGGLCSLLVLTEPPNTQIPSPSAIPFKSKVTVAFLISIYSNFGGMCAFPSRAALSLYFIFAV